MACLDRAAATERRILHYILCIKKPPCAQQCGFDWSQQDLNRATSGLKKPALCQLSYGPKNSREAKPLFALSGLGVSHGFKGVPSLFVMKKAPTLLMASAPRER